MIYQAAFIVIALTSVVNINANNNPPQLDAGYTIITGMGEEVILNSGVYYDQDFDPLQKFKWKLISKPKKSKTKLHDSKSSFPVLKPDKVGRYVLTMKVSDGYLDSKKDTVDIYAFLRRKYPTEFRLVDSLYYKIFERSIDSAFVSGDFNQWSTTACKMNSYKKDGTWTAWIDLEPGEYEYKFLP